MVVGADFSEVINRGGTGALQGHRVDQIKRRRILSRRGLDQKNFHIRVASIEAIFQKRGEDSPGVWMAALDHLIDDFVFGVELSVAQLAEEGEEIRVPRGLCV